MTGFLPSRIMQRSSEDLEDMITIFTCLSMTTRYYNLEVTKILRCQEPMWNLPKLNILHSSAPRMGTRLADLQLHGQRHS